MSIKVTDQSIDAFAIIELTETRTHITFSDKLTVLMISDKQVIVREIA